MLPATMPFLMSALTLGTIAFVVFFVSTVILTIPVFATRGRAQLAWLAGVGFVLTVEAAVLITVVVLRGNGGGASTDAAKDGEANGGGTPSAINVALRDNLFAPKALTVKVGTEVTITVKNEGKAVHNMHVMSKDQEGKDFMSEQLVNPGKESVFKVQFSKAGTINFQCDFHVPDMVGTITVTE